MINKLTRLSKENIRNIDIKRAKSNDPLAKYNTEEINNMLSEKFLQEFKNLDWDTIKPLQEESILRSNSGEGGFEYLNHYVYKLYGACGFSELDRNLGLKPDTKNLILNECIKEALELTDLTVKIFTEQIQKHLIN